MSSRMRMIAFAASELVRTYLNDTLLGGGNGALRQVLQHRCATK